MAKVKKDDPGLPQLQRIFYIDKCIRHGKKVDIGTIKSYANISKESVIRDINFMRDELHAPIEYCRKMCSYIYTAEFSAFNFADEKILLLYVLIKQLAQAQGYLPFSGTEILDRVRTNISGDYLKVVDKIAYEVSEYEPVNYLLFSLIVESMLKRKQISFVYYDAKGSVQNRRAEPVKVLHYSGKWYLLAWSCDSKALRLFLLSRMENGAMLTDRDFISQISDEEAGSFIGSSFGIFKQDNNEIARVRFYEPIARTVKRQVWHADQKVEEGSGERGDYVDFLLPVGGFGELIGRVMRYGVNAEIIESARLRQQWLTVIKEMHKRFIE